MNTDTVTPSTISSPPKELDLDAIDEMLRQRKRDLEQQIKMFEVQRDTARVEIKNLKEELARVQSRLAPRRPRKAEQA